MSFTILTAICENGKTFKSFDLSTICPRREAHRSCPYCYVESARKIGSCRAKTEHDRIRYKHQLLYLAPKTLEKLRACGGLRMFSFGDYIPWMDEDIESLIEDAAKVHMPLKAITKVPAFVHKYADRIDVINVSVDTIGYGVPWDIARELRNKYPSVYIRAAVLSMEDLPKLEWVDILTLNHGCSNGFHRFTKEEKAEIFARYPDKMCCQTGHCWDCRLKCRGSK